MSVITRRGAMGVLGGAAAIALSPLAWTSRGWTQQIEVTKEMILNDPAAPTGGNPGGDVTIVNFTDYNCPYCKKVAPVLARVIEEDGRIRHVYKDWPVIRPTSIDGARLALAAHHQGRYETAHTALMGIPGSGIEPERMRDALREAGIGLDAMDTGAACRTWNVLLAERRAVAAALIAVD